MIIIFIGIISLLVIIGVAVAMIAFGGDDINLKILMLIIIILYTVAVIGVWEDAVKPIFNFVTKNISINP